MELEEISWLSSITKYRTPVRCIYIIISRMFSNEAVMSHEMISIRDSKEWSSDSMTIARE